MNTFDHFHIRVNEGGSAQQYVSCPRCSKERKKKTAKCLSVNVQEGVWCCHHCGWCGSLKQGAHYSDPAWNKPAYRKPALTLIAADLPIGVVEWFRKRGITQDTLVKAQICTGRVYMPQVEETVNAIGFPMLRSGELINCKWRDKDKNFRLETGAERILYGLDDIADSEIVYWVEGEIDKLSLAEIGIWNCLSVPDGAPPPDSTNYSSKFEYLVSAENDLSEKTHVLMLDADAAGRRLEEELSRRLGREKCERVIMPDGCKDANEILVKFGWDGLIECVTNAKPYPVEGLHDAKDYRVGVLRIKNKEVQSGMRTGWRGLDHFFTVRLGELTVVTGVPNHGKSNFLDCLLINLAKAHGWNVGIFSPENQPIERHIAGLTEKVMELPLDSIPEHEIDDVIEWIDKRFCWILPAMDEDWSLDAILSRAETLVYRRGINVLVLDPWNEIEHRRPARLSESEYISEALSKIRRFGRYHNVHVFIVAHPTKPSRDSKGEPINLYDISGSANWRNKTDNGLVVYRHINEQTLNNNSTPKTSVFVRKIRFKEIGRIGSIDFRYDPACNCYYEWSAACE